MLEFYDTIGNEILILVGGSRAIVCRRDISSRDFPRYFAMFSTFKRDLRARRQLNRRIASKGFVAARFWGPRFRRYYLTVIKIEKYKPTARYTRYKLARIVCGKTINPSPPSSPRRSCVITLTLSVSLVSRSLWRAGCDCVPKLSNVPRHCVNTIFIGLKGATSALYTPKLSSSGAWIRELIVQSFIMALIPCY